MNRTYARHEYNITIITIIRNMNSYIHKKSKNFEKKIILRILKIIKI